MYTQFRFCLGFADYVYEDFFSCVHIYMGLSFYMAWRLLWVNLCNDDPTYTEEKQGTHVEERNLWREQTYMNTNKALCCVDNFTNHGISEEGGSLDAHLRPWHRKYNGGCWEITSNSIPCLTLKLKWFFKSDIYMSYFWSQRTLIQSGNHRGSKPNQ